MKLEKEYGENIGLPRIYRLIAQDEEDARKLKGLQEDMNDHNGKLNLAAYEQKSDRSKVERLVLALTEDVRGEQ